MTRAAAFAALLAGAAAQLNVGGCTSDQDCRATYGDDSATCVGVANVPFSKVCVCGGDLPLPTAVLPGLLAGVGQTPTATGPAKLVGNLCVPPDPNVDKGAVPLGFLLVFDAPCMQPSADLQQRLKTAVSKAFRGAAITPLVFSCGSLVVSGFASVKAGDVDAFSDDAVKNSVAAAVMDDGALLSRFGVPSGASVFTDLACRLPNARRTVPGLGGTCFVVECNPGYQASDDRRSCVSVEGTTTEATTTEATMETTTTEGTMETTTTAATTTMDTTTTTEGTMETTTTAATTTMDTTTTTTDPVMKPTTTTTEATTTTTTTTTTTEVTTTTTEATRMATTEATTTSLQIGGCASDQDCRAYGDDRAMCAVVTNDFTGSVCVCGGNLPPPTTTGTPGTTGTTGAAWARDAAKVVGGLCLPADANVDEVVVPLGFLLKFGASCMQPSADLQQRLKTAVSKAFRGAAITPLVFSCGSLPGSLGVSGSAFVTGGDVDTFSSGDAVKNSVAAVLMDDDALLPNFGVPSGASVFTGLACRLPNARSTVPGLKDTCFATECSPGYRISNDRRSCEASNHDDDGDDLTTAEKLGIGLGVSAFVIILVAVVAFVCLRSKGEAAEAGAKNTEPAADRV